MIAAIKFCSTGQAFGQTPNDAKFELAQGKTHFTDKPFADKSYTHKSEHPIHLRNRSFNLKRSDRPYEIRRADPARITADLQLAATSYRTINRIKQNLI